MASICWTTPDLLVNDPCNLYTLILNSPAVLAKTNCTISGLTGHQSPKQQITFWGGKNIRACNLQGFLTDYVASKQTLKGCCFGV